MQNAMHKGKRKAEHDEGHPSKSPKAPVKSTPLSADLQKYLESVAASINDEKDAETIASVVEQCRKEIAGQEIAVCQHSHYARHLQTVMCKSYKAAVEMLEHLRITVKNKVLFNMMCTPTASRFIDALLHAACSLDFTNDKSDKVDSEIAAWCELLTENWHWLATDSCCTYVLRAFVRATAGFEPHQQLTAPVNLNKKKKKKPLGEVHQADRQSVFDNAKPRKVSKTMENCCREALRVGLDWTSCKTLIIHDHCSMLVQDLLLADRLIDKSAASNRILTSINDEAADSDSARNNYIQMCYDRNASRVMEGLVFSAQAERVERFFQVVLQPNINDMLVHPIGNYVMQRVLCRLHSEDVCTDAIDDVLPQLPQIMAKRFFGLLPPLITCAAHTSDGTQKQCIKALRVAVKCDEKAAVYLFVPNVLHLGVEGYNYSNSTSQIQANVVEQHPEMSRTSYHGACTLMALCRLQRNSVLSKSLKALPDVVYVQLAKHLYGGRVIDAILDENPLPKTVRERITSVLMMRTTELAQDRLGSRIVEKLYATGDEVRKKEIVEALRPSIEKLRTTPWGRAVISNLQVVSAKGRK